MGAGDVRSPDRRDDSQLFHPHLEADPDRPVVPLRDGADDAGDRGQRVGARRDGPLRALRQHDHRQRRRLRRVPGGPTDPEVRGWHDQHPERRAPRTPQRHRRRDRGLCEAGARPAVAAAAAGRRGARARGVRGANAPAAAGDRVARGVSRCGVGGAGRSVRLGSLLRAWRAQGELLDPAARGARRRPARRRAAGRGHQPRRGALVAGGDVAIGIIRGLRRRAAARPRAVDTRSGGARARRHDWSLVVPRIRRVYDEALAAPTPVVR